MRAPLSWLKDFTPIEADPGDAAAIGHLRDAFDSLGLVVEQVERVGEGLEGVVLAQVLEVLPIEGADRIRQVFVDAGGEGRVEIVCGATNFAPGDVVPLATVGAELPNGMVIARRKMRGVTSDGMLCSGRELHLDDGVDGLLVLAKGETGSGELPEAIKLGAPLAEYLGIERDVVFHLEIEPNRPDCLSIAGIARDLAAAVGLSFSLPAATSGARSGPATSGPEAGAGEESGATIKTFAPEACPRLLGQVLTGVVPVPSPERVARRLELAGMRPINSVVDASNYVMLELGQPTHPYDLDRLGGGGISVRWARPGEHLETLDGNDHALVAEDLVITDANDEVVGLAGAMGGASSEITEATRRVLLEVADFESRAIGTAAQRHGLRTEASVRFWRGTDPEGLGRAAARFAQLVIEAQLAAGLEAPVVAPVLLAGPGRAERPPIRLRISRLNALLGTELTQSRVAELLAPIEFSSTPDGEDLLVRVPSFRPDATREVDLIEEVARHHGYRAIEPTQRRSPKVGRLSEGQRARRELRRVLQGLGASEAWTSSLVDPALLARVGSLAPALEVLNPVVSGESALRTHLLPGLLAALGHNEARRNGAIRLFEIGKVFHTEDGVPAEEEHLAVLLAGTDDGAPAAVRLWQRLLDATRVEPGAVNLGALGGTGADAHAAAGLYPSRAGLLSDASGAVVGALGEVDPGVLERFGLEQRPVGVVVLNLDALFALPRRPARARPISRFPSSDLDLAFVLPEEVPAAELEAALRAASGEELESITLIDVYRGPGIAEGARGLTFRLRLSSLEHTLSDAELVELRRRNIEAATARGATLRG